MSIHSFYTWGTQGPEQAPGFPVQRSSQQIILSPAISRTAPGRQEDKGGAKGIIAEAREVFPSHPSTRFKGRSEMQSGEKGLEVSRRRCVCHVSEGGVRRVGLGLGGQLPCLNSELWVFLSCAMAQRCLQEQDCLSYHSSLLGSSLTSLACLPPKETGCPVGSSFPECQLVT